MKEKAPETPVKGRKEKAVETPEKEKEKEKSLAVWMKSVVVGGSFGIKKGSTSSKGATRKRGPVDYAPTATGFRRHTASVTAALGYHPLKLVWNDGNPHGPGAGPDVCQDSSTSSAAWGIREGLRPYALTRLIIHSPCIQQIPSTARTSSR